MNNEPGKHQIHGDHYRNMGMDPNYFSMANGYDSDAFQILKYISRRKEGKRDVEKALSYVKIRNDHYQFIRFPIPPIITMENYIRVNKFTDDTNHALRMLDQWQHRGASVDGEERDRLIDAINRLIASYDNTTE